MAVIQPLWVQQTSEVPSMFEGVATAHTCAHSTSNACTSLGRHCNTTRPSDSSCKAAFIIILLVTHVRPSELQGLRKKELVPPLAPLLPCWSIVIARFRTKTGIRDGSVLTDQRWLQWINKLLPAFKAANLKEQDWNFDHPAAAKLSETATDASGLNDMTMYQTRHSGASIGQWKAFNSVTRYDKSSRLAADYHSLPRTLRNKLETLAPRAWVSLTWQLQVRRLKNTCLDNLCLTCSVDLVS